MAPHITFCQMTQNRLGETIACINRALALVDKVVIVDGGSIDDTIFYMRNWAKKEPKINFFLHPWRDNFPEQRNNYLAHVPNGTWALVSDPDELFTEEAIAAIPDLVEQARVQHKAMIRFRCRSVSMEGPERVWENLDNYYKGLLFRVYSNTRYVGNPHEQLTGTPHTLIDTQFLYEHIKQQNVIWHRGARNMFCGGGGPNLGSSNPRWVALRELCSGLGLHNWHEFDTYLLRGLVDERIKDWMYQYKDVDGFDGASEHRELWKLYYEIYHPEQKRQP